MSNNWKFSNLSIDPNTHKYAIQYTQAISGHFHTLTTQSIIMKLCRDVVRDIEMDVVYLLTVFADRESWSNASYFIT